MADRGRCGGCGRTFALTSRGLVRGHAKPEYRGMSAEAWPERACPGAGMPAVGPDEPLLRTELADARRQLADLEREVRRLRHVAEAHRLDAVAARARADGLRHLRDVNKHLLAALRSLLDNDHDAAERDAAFERDMEAIRVKHPVLDEVEQER